MVELKEPNLDGSGGDADDKIQFTNGGGGTTNSVNANSTLNEPNESSDLIGKDGCAQKTGKSVIFRQKNTDDMHGDGVFRIHRAHKPKYAHT